MNHVESFAQTAVKTLISECTGFLKPCKDPKFLEVLVFEENDKSCLIAVIIEVTEKSTGRREPLRNFQVWSKTFGMWVRQKPGNKVYDSYLRRGGYNGYDLSDAWDGADPQRSISNI